MEAQRSRSAALFNNRYFARVVEAINELAPSDEAFFTTRGVAAHTGLSDSTVRPVILRLADAELLSRLPRLGGPRGPQHFRIEASPSWEAVVSLALSLSSTSVADTPDQTRTR